MDFELNERCGALERQFLSQIGAVLYLAAEIPPDHSKNCAPDDDLPLGGLRSATNCEMTQLVS
jgi:hypothetical protein